MVKIVSAIWLDSTPILKGSTLRELGAFHFSCPSKNLTRGFAARRLFRLHPCHEDTIHLQIPMSSPGFKPRPNGTALSVTNLYTGEVAMNQ
ncbi:hypothetical protein TNCV_248721 [Trichonephila clavipes]|nr:hypothetical protein TNCV_248721 [Trichonephila clavipes]